VKIPWRKTGPRRATFSVVTDGKEMHRVTITQGGMIHVEQPVEISLGGETHTFVLKNTGIRWLR